MWSEHAASSRLPDRGHRASRVDEIARIVEDQFRAGVPHRMWVVGRVSRVCRESGTWSFALSTDDGELWLPAMIDGGAAAAIEEYLLRNVDAAIEDLLVEGRTVRAAGLLRYHFATHQLLLTVSEIDPATTGDELETERLTHVEWARAGRLGHRQRSLSPVTAPLRVAIVGPAAGTAVASAASVLRGSDFAVRIGLYRAELVGEEAVPALVEALRRAAGDRPDLILLVRDERRPFGIAALNAREVATAIAECPVPVITGVSSHAGPTAADEVAYQSLGDPVEAAAAVVRRLRHAVAALEVAAGAVWVQRDAALRRAAEQLRAAADRVAAERTPALARADAALRHARMVTATVGLLLVAVFVAIALVVGPLLWLVGAGAGVAFVAVREYQRNRAFTSSWRAPTVSDLDFTSAIERLNQISRELSLTSSPATVRRLEQEAQWLVERCHAELETSPESSRLGAGRGAATAVASGPRGAHAAGLGGDRASQGGEPDQAATAPRDVPRDEAPTEVVRRDADPRQADAGADNAPTEVIELPDAAPTQVTAPLRRTGDGDGAGDQA